MKSATSLSLKVLLLALLTHIVASAGENEESETADKVQYRFPQFFLKFDQSQKGWWHEGTRLEDINKFVEEFRGWQDDAPNLAPELKVVNITTQMYYDEILDSKTPWIISFIKHKKSQEHLVHSEELYQNLQILADEYKGKVRFGIVDIIEEEFFKISYQVYTLPQTFYILDGTAYEMHVLNIFYDNVRAFIEGNYLNETKVYQQFKAPRFLVNGVTVYAYYAYDDGLKYYNKQQYDIYEYLREGNYTQYEQVQGFFVKYDVKEQYHILLSFTAFVILVAFVITMQVLRCVKFFLCGKKMPQVIEDINKAKLD